MEKDPSNNEEWMIKLISYKIQICNQSKNYIFQRKSIIWGLQAKGTKHSEYYR